MKQEMVRWQWHQLDHMQIICTSLQADNHSSTSSLNFLQAGCPSCRPTNSVKALKAMADKDQLSLTNPRDALHHGERAATANT